MTVHHYSFAQLTKLHIFTEPEATGESAVLEVEVSSEDKPGECFNWNIYRSHNLNEHSIHNYL